MINDRLSIADIYKVKGVILSNLKNYDLAEELIENSLRLNKDTQNKLNYAESSSEIGKLCLQKQKPGEAKNHLTEALKYYKKIKNEKTSLALTESLEKIEIAAV